MKGFENEGYILFFIKILNMILNEIQIPQDLKDKASQRLAKKRL